MAVQSARIYDTVKRTTKNYKEVPIIDVLNYVKEHKQGYEGLMGAVKPYFDFDFEYADEAAREADEDLALFECVKQVKELCGDGLSVLTANGKKTGDKFVNSIHIIAHNAESFESGAAFKKFITTTIKENKTEWKRLPDMSVYKAEGKRQLFRLPYASKEEENRPFILLDDNLNPISIDDITNEQYMKCIISTSAEVMGTDEQNENEHNEIGQEEQIIPAVNDIWNIIKSSGAADDCVFKDMKGSTIITTRTRPSMCDMCNRIHTKDNTTSFYISPDNTIFKYCFKAGKVSKFIGTVGDVNLSDSGHQNKTGAPDKKIDYLKALDKPYKPVIISTTSKTIDNAHILNNKDIMDNIGSSKYDIIGIKSPMGTGKSYAIKNKLTEMIKNTPDISIVLGTFRQSLASKNKYDFKGLGFTHYQDKIAMIDTIRRLIIQMDSMGKMKWIKTVPALLILDEISAIRQHLTGSTFLNQDRLSDNYARFKWLIKNAKQIILMDANLSDADIKFVYEIKNSMRFDSDNIIQNNIPMNNTILYVNEYRSPERRQAYLSDSPHIVMNKIVQDVIDNKKCYVSSNGSIESIKALAELIRNKAALADPTRILKILTIHKDSLHLEEVKAALNDPDATWGKYDAIICSPSVQSGISYDIKNTIDSVYGLFDNYTNMSSDAGQMLYRVRHPKSLDMFISIQQSDRRQMKSFNRLMGGVMCNIKHLFDDPDCNDATCLKKALGCDAVDIIDGETMLRQNDFMILYVRNRQEKEYDRVHYVENFINILRHQGADAHRMMTKEQQTEKKVEIEGTKEEVKSIRKILKTQENDTLYKTANITEDEAKTIQKKAEAYEATEDDRNKLTRHYILNQYKITERENITIQWFEIYNKSNVRKHFSNQREATTAETLKESIQALFIKERNRFQHERQTKREQGDSGATTDAGLILNTKRNIRAVRWQYIFNMMEILGFVEIQDVGEKVESDDMDKRCITLIEFLKGKEMHKAAMILDKDYRKLKALQELKHDKSFTKHVLKFVNGSLNAEWGVAIRRREQREAYYIINDYIEGGIFVNKYLDGITIKPAFDQYTPAYGGYADDDNETQQDTELSIEDKLRELHNMIK